MIVLRYLYLLALVAWLGGMLALGGLAAPSIFAGLQQDGGSTGRVLAGAVFGDILQKFQTASYMCAVLMLATLVGMRLLGPKPVHFNARLAIVLIMSAIAVYSGLILSDHIHDLQQHIGGPVGALNAHDVRRVSFAHLHSLSTVLLLVNVVGGLSLLYWEARG